jgi:putative DNA primase/helicase
MMKASLEQKKSVRGMKLSRSLKMMKVSPRKASIKTSIKAGNIPIRLPEILRRIRHARRCGWAIIPVVEGGKAPAIGGGYKAASKDWKKIEAFFDANPRLNYGIVTGAVSRLFVVDVDGPTGKATLAELERERGQLPRTVVQLTPNKGAHLLFNWPGYPVPNSAGRIGPGVDIRGDRGYIVGPGSRTSNGIYRFALGRTPDDVEIAPAPLWLLKLIGHKPAPGEAVSASPPNLAADELARGKAYAEAALQSERERLQKAPLHQRNNTLNICSFKLGRFVARGLLAGPRVAAELSQIAKTIGLDDGEIARTVDSGLKAGLSNPARLPFEKTTPANREQFPPGVSRDDLTRQLAALGDDDIANAERFVRRYSHRVIFSETRGFLLFDGQRYRANAWLRCVGLAKDVVSKIADEIQYVEGEEARVRRAKFARYSRFKLAIDRLLELAKHMLLVDDNVLDADPWLLNTETSTIDLRTGRYHPHDPRDLITKICPVKAKPNSKCPIFDKFVERITGGDSDLAAYIQRAVGYTLTGITSAQVLFFIYGKRGKNGKSTLVNLIRKMLGDYAAHTPTETLLTKTYDNAIPADLARLEGKRMVTAVESNVGRQLDEAKIKGMTGGEPITARHLYKNFSEFVPQFKLWVVTNYLPHVRATDAAIWRRIRVIPLNQEIPTDEVDPDLPDKLMDELPGILSWAIRGTLAWQQDGLGEPESVVAASAGWRKAVDHVRRFASETLIAGCAPTEVIPAGEMYSRFKSWCNKNGEWSISSGQFKARLEEMLDITHVRTKHGSEWRGVRWKN